MTHNLDSFSKRITPQIHHFSHDIWPTTESLRRVKAELKQRGAVAYNVWLPETRALASLLHRDEHIMGSVFGKYEDGRGALIATDQRALFVDKKPLFLHCDEIGYNVIGGVTYSRSGPFGYVTLHTRLGNFGLRTWNQNNAANFVDYIETKCLQSSASSKDFAYPQTNFM